MNEAKKGVSLELTHNLLVGANNYSKTIEGIKNAINAKLNISINTPLCTINDDYLSLIKYMDREFGIKYFTCSGLIVTGNAINENSKTTQLSKERLFNILQKVCEYAKNNEIDINFTSPGWLEEKQLKRLGLNIPSCGACLSNMAIAPNGDVIPCQSWLSDVTLGNLSVQNWRSIWKNKKCVNIKKQTMRSNNVCPLTAKNMEVGHK